MNITIAPLSRASEHEIHVVRARVGKYRHHWTDSSDSDSSDSDDDNNVVRHRHGHGEIVVSRNLGLLIQNSINEYQKLKKRTKILTDQALIELLKKIKMACFYTLQKYKDNYDKEKAITDIALKALSEFKATCCEGKFRSSIAEKMLPSFVSAPVKWWYGKGIELREEIDNFSEMNDALEYLLNYSPQELVNIKQINQLADQFHNGQVENKFTPVDENIKSKVFTILKPGIDALEKDPLYKDGVSSYRNF